MKRLAAAGTAICSIALLSAADVRADGDVCPGLQKSSAVLRKTVEDLRGLLAVNNDIGSRRANGESTINILQRALTASATAYGNEIAEMARYGCEMPR